MRRHRKETRGRKRRPEMESMPPDTMADPAEVEAWFGEDDDFDVDVDADLDMEDDFDARWHGDWVIEGDWD